MILVDAAVRVLHVVFAGFWTGSILFMTVAVLPTARSGTIGPETLNDVVSRSQTLSRLSVVVLFLTGGHLAGTGYTVDSLISGPRGHLVLTMLTFWFVLAALVEMGAARITDGVQEQKVRTPEADARPFFLAATVIATLLLVVAGLLASSAV